MAVSWFLLLCVCVMVLLLLVVNVYMLIHWQHPDDKNEAYLPKGLVILGLLLAEACVLALPLDVANNSGNVGCMQGWVKDCGGLNMAVFWEIMYVVITLLCTAILPFAIFFYEGNDGLTESTSAALGEAVKYTMGCLFASGLVLGLCYFFIGRIRIPVNEYTANIVSFETHYSTSVSLAMTAIESTTADGITRTMHRTWITFASSFIVYMIALVSFVGWFLFAIFGGVGLAALPMDLITAFTGRPKPLSAEQLAHEQLLLQARVSDLIEVGTLLQSERKDRRSKGGNFITRAQAERSDQQTMTKFKQMVYLLETDYDKFRAAKDLANYNPLWPFFLLISGVISAALTTLWILHVIVYMLFYPPQSQFLNDYFIQFEGWFPLFGVMSVAIFTLYLLFCVVAGNFKLGMRLLCISLHPMKINGTYMNSFLFNLILILLCTFPVIEFATDAFTGYARFSNIYQFFGVQMRYLVFFSIFYSNNVFVYLLLGFAFLATVIFLIRPQDKPAKVEEVKTSIRRKAEHMR